MLEREYWRRATDMDVSLLRWPDQADEADRLARIGAPRLLLVKPGVAPPTETSCVVDWLRLPADGEDMCARLAALAERAARHPSRPFVDDDGQVSHQGTAVFLPPVHERIARILIESRGRPVPAEDLIPARLAPRRNHRDLAWEHLPAPRSHRTLGPHHHTHHGPRIRHARSRGDRHNAALTPASRGCLRAARGRRRRSQRVVTTKPSTRPSPDGS